MKGVSTLASIYKRGKTWAYKVYYYVDGKQKAVSKSGFKTKAEAKDASIKRENEMLTHKNVNQELILLADYMEYWKKLYKENTVSEKTIARLNTVIQYVRRTFNLSLKDITNDNYQEYINELAKTRVRDTVKKYHEFTSGAIKHAVNTRKIPFDPTSTVVLKGKIEKGIKEENKYLNYEDFKRLETYLLDTLQPSYTSHYIMLCAMYTGARFGECLGLTWDCIDFEKQTIRIEKGFDYSFTNDFTDGKTTNSKRTIVVPKKLLNLLSTLPKTNDKVFTTITNEAANKALKRALKQIGASKQINFHGLRHTHASILLSQGVQLLSVSKRLGHADATITLKTYAHIIQEKELEDDEKIKNIFN